MNKPWIHHCDKLPNSEHMFLVTEKSLYLIRNVDWTSVPNIARVDWKACPYCGEILIGKEVAE